MVKKMMQTIRPQERDIQLVAQQIKELKEKKEKPSNYDGVPVERLTKAPDDVNKTNSTQWNSDWLEVIKEKVLRDKLIKNWITNMEELSKLKNLDNYTILQQQKIKNYKLNN